MMKEYILIKNTNYELVLQFDEEDFDYYMNVNVKIKFAKTECVLYNDNILELKNIVVSLCDNIGRLDNSLNERDIGILLNSYYYEMDEGQTSDKIILDENEVWIGEKYSYLMSNNYVTWFYKYNDNIILKITPIFHSEDEENDYVEYSRFIENYKDIFRDKISLEQIIGMKNVIVSTYSKYIN